jgi:hypothetical protein
MQRNLWSRIKLIGLIAVMGSLMATAAYHSVLVAPGTLTCGGLPATIVATSSDDWETPVT